LSSERKPGREYSENRKRRIFSSSPQINSGGRVKSPNCEDERGRLIIVLATKHKGDNMWEREYLQGFLRELKREQAELRREIEELKRTVEELASLLNAR